MEEEEKPKVVKKDGKYAGNLHIKSKVRGDFTLVTEAGDSIEKIK